MTTSIDSALVICGGAAPQVAAAAIPCVDLVIAADSGLDVARHLGIAVDIVVGDMDSVDEHSLRRARAEGAQIHTHPVDKDASDLELAVDLAVSRGASTVTVLTTSNGRFDHVWGNVATLARPATRHVRMQAIVDRAHLYVVHDEIELRGEPGTIISQFPVNGPVTGLVIEGSEWAGRYERVAPGSSLCLHDEFTDEPFRLRIESGTMLVVVPGE